MAKPSAQLRTTPLTIDLGGRSRELRFNLNAALLVREAGKDGASVWEEIGEREGADGQPEKIYRVDLENLRLYLWAMLQRDCAAHGETLTLEQVGEMLEGRDAAASATRIVSLEIARWYGVPITGEAQAPR